MIKIQTTGYRSRSLFADVALGVFDGLDNALWCYAFATVIFAGVLAQFLPLLVVILLCGWAMLGIFVALTSAKALHVVSLDEQGIVILSAIAGLMVTALGPVATTGVGLSTMLAIMSLTSVLVAASFYVVGHFRLTRLLELLPYPVICGFMAGVGWLLLEAGVGVVVQEPISLALLEALKEPDNQFKLSIFVAGAVLLGLSVRFVPHAWSMPAASLLLVFAFYAVTLVLGMSREEMVNEGWLFNISIETSGAVDLARMVSFADIDYNFMLSVLPEVVTIAFLALLSASMSLSALMASGNQDLDTAEEMAGTGGGNVFCAAVGCPPGYTDIVASTIFEEFGASSRLMPIISSLVCVVMAVFGSLVIGYLPKLLVGATVFLFAFQMLYEWMYQNVRGFKPIDYAIVCIILGTVVFVGFMAGIVVGILLALLLFVMRYSMISAVQGQYTLANYRSSVERAQSSNILLDRHGSEGLVYTLRGFLFFGTANAVLDTIRDDAHVKNGHYKVVLLDLKRVTGLDISALNTLVQIKEICESSDVRLIYSGLDNETMDSILMLDAVSRDAGAPLIFPEADYAVEYMEDLLLQFYSGQQQEMTIKDHLFRIFGDQGKVDLLLSAMERVEIGQGHNLFELGDEDTGLFMLESGSMTALIGTPDNGMRRVKKFRPGALIGELSAYTADKTRTATVVADKKSVLMHLTPEKLAQLDIRDMELRALIHELVARTLGGRIAYMNRRLFLELR